MHLGTRCTLVDEHFDLNNDLRCGFEMVKAREIDVIGVKALVERIWKKVKGRIINKNKGLKKLKLLKNHSLMIQ